MEAIQPYIITDDTDVQFVLAGEIGLREAAFRPDLNGIEVVRRLADHALERVLTISRGGADFYTGALDKRLIQHLDDRVLQLLVQNQQDLLVHAQNETFAYTLAADFIVDAPLPRAFDFAATLRAVSKPTNSGDNPHIIKRIESAGRPVALLEMVYAGYSLAEINTYLAYAGSEGRSSKGTLSGEQVAPLFAIRDRIKSASAGGVTAARIADIHAEFLNHFQAMQFFQPDELNLDQDNLFGFSPVAVKGRPVCELATVEVPDGRRYITNDVEATYFRIDGYAGLGITVGVNSVGFGNKRRLTYEY